MILHSVAIWGTRDFSCINAVQHRAIQFFMGLSVLLTVLYTGASVKTVQCLPLPVLYTDTQFQNSPMCASNCPLYRYVQYVAKSIAGEFGTTL
jgi:hypothetical protein